MRLMEGSLSQRIRHLRNVPVGHLRIPLGPIGAVEIGRPHRGRQGPHLRFFPDAPYQENRGPRAALALVWGLALYLLLCLVLPNLAGAYELHADGTITGTCRVWRDPNTPYVSYVGEDGHANFTLLLDTGDRTETARCIDNGLSGSPLRYAPADGSTVSYTATPLENGMYKVITDGTGVPVNPEEASAFRAAGLAVYDMNAQRIRGYLTITPPTGFLTLSKSSADSSLTGANTCYDLAGATYDVYSNATCTIKVGTLTTATDGTTPTLELATGTYYLKETAAPACGYAIDETTYEVEVTPGSTSSNPVRLSVSDQPLTDTLVARVQKQDLSQGSATSGDASDWSGFRFRLTHHAGPSADDAVDASAIWEATADGTVDFSTGEAEGTWVFKDASDATVFPLGLYVLEEVRPEEGSVYKGYQHASGTLEILVSDDGSHTTSGLRTSKVTSATGDWKQDASVTVAAAQTVITLRERPSTSSLRVTKTDADNTSAQGDATLSEATFTFYNASAHPVTTPSGEVVAKGATAAVATVSWDEATGAWSTPLVELSAGTYLVRETAAPEGYRPDADWSQLVTIDGSTELVEVDRANTVKRGGIAGRKVDADLDAAYAQGDATLAGAQIAVINASAAAVVVGGMSYAPGAVVMTLTTDGEGAWHTAADALPYGTYKVREASPSPGYLLNEAWSDTYEVREDGIIVSHDAGERLQEQVVRGGVRVGKVDAENGRHLSSGASTLAYAEFEIANASGRGVWASGDDGERLYQPGEVVLTLVTNEAGIASTAAGALPYGTYEVREAKAPKGYLLDEDWSRTFSIRGNGIIIDLSSEADSASDQPKRMGFSFQKKRAGSMETLPNTAFLVVANSDADGDGIHEAHVIVTDENGCFSSEDFDQGARDNANDAAVTLGEGALRYDADAGRWTVDVTKVRVDSSALDAEHGVWFTGRTDLTTQDGSHASLPYDTYTVAELPCEANADLKLVTFTAVVRPTDRRMDIERNLGTIDDEGLPSVRTSASGDGTGGTVACDGEASVTDVVEYENLTPGKRYVLMGTLMDKATGEAHLDPSGAAVTAEVSFTPSQPSGVQEVTFTFDGANLVAGHDLVAFERLSLAGEVVATHEDLKDEGQTVGVTPTMGTTATCAQTGTQVAPTTGTAAIVDSVAYHGLQAGVTYVIDGSLHLVKDDGSDAGAVPNTEVTLEFVPEAASGSLEITFALDASALAGRDVVVFERITRDGSLVATHEDIEDEGQTVHVPSVATTALDAATLTHHLVPADGMARVVDTIAYQNLVPGLEYTLEGTLHVRSDDGGDAGALLNADGEPVRSVVTFTAAAPNGSVEVPFEVGAELASGKVLVAFETLSLDGEPLATHEDITDGSQSLYGPALRTTATDADDGDKSVPAVGTARIDDVVTYAGLETGREYVATASVHAVDASGTDLGAVEGATGSGAFVPETASGAVTVPIELEMPAPEGSVRLVVFEELSTGGAPVAAHADLDDEGQSLDVPQLRTTLTDKGTGTHEGLARERATLADRVSYEGLTPGTEYVVSGTLHVRGDDGSDLGVLLQDGTVLDADATDEQARLEAGRGLAIVNTSEAMAVTSSESFVPESDHGFVTVEFTFDASSLDGYAVVSFEQLRQGRVPYAAHEDIADVDQTVTFPKLETQVEQDLLTPAPEQVVTDLVAYEGLEVGQTYVVSGGLMDASTGEAVTDVVTEPVSFEPESADGTVRVTFLVDATDLAGRTLVAFETLLDAEGHVIALHEDLSDEAQSVAVGEGDAPREDAGQGNATPRDVPHTGDPTSLIAPIALALMALGTLLVAKRVRVRPAAQGTRRCLRSRRARHRP